MTERGKLNKLKELADKMAHSSEYLSSDASHLHKAVYEYRQFIIQHWSEESDKDLEEAKEYSFNIQSELYNQLPEDLKEVWKKETEQNFHNGIRYKKEQLMKDAIDGKVCWYDGEVFLDTDDSMFLYLYTHKGFKVGDKVKVIIIKED